MGVIGLLVVPLVHHAICIAFHSRPLSHYAAPKWVGGRIVNLNFLAVAGIDFWDCLDLHLLRCQTAVSFYKVVKLVTIVDHLDINGALL